MNITDIIIAILAIAIVLFFGVCIYSIIILMKVMKETEDGEPLTKTDMPILKIYEITHRDGEKEFCTGETNIDALVSYVSITECDFYEMKDAEIIEVPKWKWKELFIGYEDQSRLSFEDWMKENGSQKGIICGTMYNY